MNDKITFLYEAIKDTQGVIRGQDTKCGFLVAILFAPIFAFDRVNPIIQQIYRESWPHYIVLSLALLLWALAGLVVGMALYGIGNPVDRIIGNSASGVFYGGDLFKLTWTEAFMNGKTTAVRTLAEESVRLPDTEKQIMEELVFEKMKLAYIRSLKVHRVNWAIKLIKLAVILLVFLYICRRV